MKEPAVGSMLVASIPMRCYWHYPTCLGRNPADVGVGDILLSLGASYDCDRNHSRLTVWYDNDIADIFIPVKLSFDQLFDAVSDYDVAVG